MTKTRIFLISMVALMVAATVVGTRIYEENLRLEQPIKAVVRPGYHVFRKETNGFLLHYPLQWNYQSVIDTPDFTNGYFVDASNTKRVYLEAPYSGQGFILTHVSSSEGLFAPSLAETPMPIQIVTSSLFLTSDPATPIKIDFFSRCISSDCLRRGGEYVAAYWERGQQSPKLDMTNQSADTGVLLAELPQDELLRNQTLNAFKEMLDTFKFRTTAGSGKIRPALYKNIDLGYSIHYPIDFGLQENTDLSYVFMTTGTAFQYPVTFTTGTNLSEAKILVGTVLPNFATASCLPKSGLDSAVEQTTINGLQFSKGASAGAAAGNRYDTLTYALRRGAECLNVTLFLHSTVLENYPANLRPRSYDKDQIIDVFNKIILSLSLND